MKTILPYLAFQLCWITCFSQLPDNISSAWVNGDNTIDQSGIYGTAGITAPGNKPGARNFSVTWRDNSGNLWLFGGYGYSENGSGFLNDLWKYDPYTNYWTWIKGDSITDQQGCYGTKGIASSNARPGTVYNGLSWTDNSGNLWLYGGFGHSAGSMGFLNSLWKFNTTSNQWTWVKGDSLVDQTADYGHKGHAAAKNMPGARYGSLTWKDNAGNLWLFGGYGFDGNSAGLLNDLWKYDPGTNEWTWVNGENSIGQTGIYGTKGIAADGNEPGGRYSGHTWTDNAGNLWLMGGYGKDETDEGILNDLWKYNTTTNQWTWVNGGQQVNQLSDYGTRGIQTATNVPGSRYMGISWKDMYGDFWIFGGYGFNGSNAGYMNDLWKYHPGSNEWTWVKGDSLLDQTSIYGIQGTPDPDNKTGSRTGSVAWTDGGGTLWLFGGYGYDESQTGTLNDLWKVNNLQTPLALQLLQFNGSLRQENALLNWKTAHEAHNSSFIIQRSADGIHFTDIGSVKGNSKEGTFQYGFTDYTLKNYTGQKIYYRLQIVQEGSASTYSQEISFSRNTTGLELNLYPNPATQSVSISYDQAMPGNSRLMITDTKGAALVNRQESKPAGTISETIDISKLPAGTYFLSILTSSTTLQKTFIKR